MNRRAMIAAAAAMAAPAAFGQWGSLPRTPRMPVLFIGHGSPMNAIEDNEWRRGWQSLAARFGKDWPQPHLILCVSAHWLTQGWWVTGMDKPRTIHDFGGFPQELFDQRFPAPGAPAVARALGEAIKEPAVRVDEGQWGFDHGTWSVLKPMFPQAQVPVIQLSMDYGRPAAEHFALGRQLRSLRERGVLIVGSGNIVHNLRATQRGTAANQAYDWAIDFDARIAAQIQKGDLAGLADFQKLGNTARLSHPTHDHFLPLLHAAGAADAKEPVSFFNTGFQSASISMRSVVWA